MSKFYLLVDEQSTFVDDKVFEDVSYITWELKSDFGIEGLDDLTDVDEINKILEADEDCDMKILIVDESSIKQRIGQYEKRKIIDKGKEERPYLTGKAENFYYNSDYTLYRLGAYVAVGINRDLYFVTYNIESLIQKYFEELADDYNEKALEDGITWAAEEYFRELQKKHHIVVPEDYIKESIQKNIDTTSVAEFSQNDKPVDPTEVETYFLEQYALYENEILEVIKNRA